MNKKQIGGFFGVLAAAIAGLVAIQSGGPKPRTPPAATTVSVACVVTDKATTTPVVDAICVLGAQTGTTNGDGYHLFGQVPVGKVRLEVNAEGYAGYSSAPNDYSIGSNTDLTVSLERTIPPHAPLTRIRTDGRFFVNDAGTFRPVFASALAILVKDPAQRAAVLDEDAQLGFNGVRVFGGALTWAGQTPELARERLPVVLTEALQRGLYVHVAAITDSGTGYDVPGHLRAVADICNAWVNCLLELANEYDHPSQSKDVNDPAWLRQIARQTVPVGLPWALGASIRTDEGGDYPGFGGAWTTAHLDRGRDPWNQVRRIREIAGLSEESRKPAMSGEPIGAAEVYNPGKRMGAPRPDHEQEDRNINPQAFFFALGALSRMFEVGTVFHSDDGLNAQTLGPVQRQCAEAFIAGFRSIVSDTRLTYKNAGWNDSPVEKADRVVRAYSGVAGGEGWNVAVGVEGTAAIQWKNGWRDDGVVASRPGVEVRKLAH